MPVKFTMYPTVKDRVSRIKKKLLQNNFAAGIEINLLPENNIEIHLTSLVLKKEHWDIEKKQIGLKSIEEIKNHITTEIPLNIAINGKGILHKKVSSEFNDNTRIIEQIFPNAKPENFYLQKQASTNNQLFVSVIRKSVLDEILQKFRQNGFYILSVSLGPFCISSAKEFLPQLFSNQGSSESIIGKHQLIYQSDVIDTYLQKNSDAFNKFISINGISIEEELLIPASAAIQILQDNAGSISLQDVPMVKSDAEEWKQKKLFKVISWGGLIFFFLVLLINFFIFQMLNSSNHELSQQLGQNKGQFTYLEKLKNQIKEKEKFLSEAGWLEPSRTSYYADQIAQTLPENIRLSELTIHPVEKNKKPNDKTVSFKTKTITVQGVCNKSTELNEWIKKLKNLNWVKEVTVQNYSQNSENEKGIFNLEIIIK